MGKIISPKFLTDHKKTGCNFPTKCSTQLYGNQYLSYWYPKKQHVSSAHYPTYMKTWTEGIYNDVPFYPVQQRAILGSQKKNAWDVMTKWKFSVKSNQSIKKTRLRKY